MHTIGLIPYFDMFKSPDVYLPSILRDNVSFSASETD